VSAGAQVAILCGGLGTRLGQLTAQTPKPLLPVGGAPFLEHLLFEIGRFGFRDIALLAHFEHAQIEDFAANSVAAATFGLNLTVSVEPEQAGTGGALFHARDLLADDFLLLNGDTWLSINFHALAATRRCENAVAAIGLREIDRPDRYNSVELDGTRIRSFRRDRSIEGTAYINGGVIACNRSLLELLAPLSSLEDDALRVLAERGQLAGMPTNGYFLDIGVPEAFERAQREIPALRRRGALFLDRDGVLNVDHGYVGSVDRLEWIAGAERAVRIANERDLYVFVVTNQAGIARGYYGEADVRALHDHMQAHLNALGAHIDEFRYSPFHVDGVVTEFARESECRKPRPGMILDLIARWNVDPARSLLVGDKDSDLAAAEAAGIRAVKFTGGALDSLVESLTSQ